jgi:CheY-like chemotaxis protein
VGAKNCEFVLGFLREESIPVAAQDLLDAVPRKIQFFLATGKVQMKRLTPATGDTVRQREREYLWGLPAGAAATSRSSRRMIRVLVIDDSAVMRAFLSRVVGAQPDMELLGVSPDPLLAIERIRRSAPDVITLDVEMPRMNGLDFLRKLMAVRPLPVIMISSLTRQGAETTLRALELGAVDFFRSRPASTGWRTARRRSPRRSAPRRARGCGALRRPRARRLYCGRRHVPGPWLRSA